MPDTTPSHPPRVRVNTHSTTQTCIASLPPTAGYIAQASASRRLQPPVVMLGSAWGRATCYRPIARDVTGRARWSALEDSWSRLLWGNCT